MISYARQTAVCNAVRETVKQAFEQIGYRTLGSKTGDIPTTDSVLRAISLSPNIDTEQTLKQVITEYIIAALRLTEGPEGRLQITHRRNSLPLAKAVFP
jgi:hypothetical protein